MVLKSTFVTFFAKSWAIFELMCSVALTAHLAVTSTLATRSVRTAGLGTFLTIPLESFDGVDGGQLCDSSVQLVMLKIFHCHLMLLCVLEQGLVCDVFSGASLSAPTF